MPAEGGAPTRLTWHPAADIVRGFSADGKAVLFSTHYLAEAELLCDRIGLLFRGRLLREGTPASIRAECGATTLEEAFLKLVDRE